MRGRLRERELDIDRESSEATVTRFSEFSWAERGYSQAGGERDSPIDANAATINKVMEFARSGRSFDCMGGFRRAGVAAQVHISLSDRVSEPFSESRPRILDAS
jgi:hypothetical protein